MVNVWKEKLLPKIKGVFGPGSAKKAAAAEACKSFDESKESVEKELEEKKSDLHPKVVEIYEAASVAIKTVVKNPTQSGLKKNTTAVNKFFAELVKIEFPGSKPVSEAATKFGPALVSGPVLFIFEKVSTFLPAEETPAPAEPAAEAPVETTREISVEEVTKEEKVVEKVDETPAVATETPALAEPTPEPEKPAEEAEPAKPAEPAPEPAKA